jgi:hypothetical protein
LKERRFFQLKWFISAFIPNISAFSPRRRLYKPEAIIPLFHSDGINRLPLKNLYFRKVVEFPRPLIGAHP